MSMSGYFSCVGSVGEPLPPSPAMPPTVPGCEPPGPPRLSPGGRVDMPPPGVPGRPIAISPPSPPIRLPPAMPPPGARLMKGVSVFSRSVKLRGSGTLTVRFWMIVAWLMPI